MNIQLPEVSRKDGYEPFDSAKIFDSLRLETSLNFEQIKIITKKVTQFIFSTNLKFLSGPLIREIINVKLLQFGYEKARLEYTRIGFPYYDLAKILHQKYEYTKIADHIIEEYTAVKKLIKEREQKEC